jgi:hypothetical protein
MKTNQTSAAIVPKSPAASPLGEDEELQAITDDLAGIMERLEKYGAGLRPLDRRRLNGVGVVTRGFIEDAYDSAMETPKFLPQYVSLEKFSADYARFARASAAYVACSQVLEILWNINLRSADAAYSDALDYYGGVSKAFKNGVSASETIHKKLFPFFRKTKREGAEPTRKELERDAKALIEGKKDGEMVIKNIKPKMTKGEHKVIDVKYDDGVQFKEEFTTNNHE